MKLILYKTEKYTQQWKILILKTDYAN